MTLWGERERVHVKNVEQLHVVILNLRPQNGTQNRWDSRLPQLLKLNLELEAQHYTPSTRLN